MKNAMTPAIQRRVLLALTLLWAGWGSSASAGLVGFDVPMTTAGPIGSLDVKSDGSIVATNIPVPLVFGGSNAHPLVIDSYLDFTTGTPLGAAVNGVTSYSQSSADFFILLGVLSDPVRGATTPPVAMSVDLSTTVTALSGTSNAYVLTAVINSGYISPTIASNYGTVSQFGFTGSFTINFVLSQIANNIQGGSISMNAPLPASAAGGISANDGTVPAPPSVILSILGAICTAGGPITSRLRLKLRRKTA